MGTIAEIQKNALEKTIATLGAYRGMSRVDIRIYFQPDQAQPDKWVATKKGINLGLDSWKEFSRLCQVKGFYFAITLKN